MWCRPTRPLNSLSRQEREPTKQLGLTGNRPNRKVPKRRGPDGATVSGPDGRLKQEVRR
jgi:hypothetical protein